LHQGTRGGDTAPTDAQVIAGTILSIAGMAINALRPAQATEIYQCGDVTVTLRATPGYQFITFETDNKKSSTDILGNLRWNWRANRLNGKQCKLKD